MAFGSKESGFAFWRLNLGPKAVLGATRLIAVNTAPVGPRYGMAWPRVNSNESK